VFRLLQISLEGWRNLKKIGNRNFEHFGALRAFATPKMMSNYMSIEIRTPNFVLISPTFFQKSTRFSVLLNFVFHGDIEKCSTFLADVYPYNSFEQLNWSFQDVWSLLECYGEIKNGIAIKKVFIDMVSKIHEKIENRYIAKSEKELGHALTKNAKNEIHHDVWNKFWGYIVKLEHYPGRTFLYYAVQKNLISLSHFLVVIGTKVHHQCLYLPHTRMCILYPIIEAAHAAWIGIVKNILEKVFHRLNLDTEESIENLIFSYACWRNLKTPKSISKHQNGALKLQNRRSKRQNR